MNPIETPKEYNKYVEAKSPKSPILKDCFNAFWVGGLICCLGQFILEFCLYKGLDQTSSSTIVSISLIGLSALLTALNIFNKIGKFAGAGTLVPITGLLVLVLLFLLLVLQILLFLQQLNINLKDILWELEPRCLQ